MNIHVGYPFHIEAAAALGVGWVRIDGNWLGFEPTRGNYIWWLDDTVNRAHAAGLKVFMSLGYTPNWARRHPGTAGHDRNCPPANVADWTNMVKAVVTHYRAMGVTHFGMWNEANLSGFWESTIEEYTSLIAVPGSAAVRSVCSDCKVLGPELANMHDDADDVLEYVLQNAPAAFDIISHHSYNGFEELGTSFFDGDRFPEVLEASHLRCRP